MLRGLHTFYALPTARRRLLIEAAPLVAGTRLALWLLPFRAVDRLAHVMASKYSAWFSTTASEQVASKIQDIGWAIGVAAAYIPHATCLAQALAARAMLARRGIAAELRIGVARSEAGEFEAHAWVESMGTIVVGGPQQWVARYQALPLLAGGRR